MANYRRTLMAGAGALLCAPALLRAQAPYPGAKPIKLVVPFAPGGGPDVLTRQFLPRLGAVLDTTVFVDNKVGAGGIIAAEYAAQQAPDGFTLLLAASTHLVQKILQPKAAFDPVKGFSHLTRISYAPSFLVVSAAAPWRSLDELLKAARAAPGRLNYGSGGIGSAAHLAGAALAVVGGVDVVHIPYRGSVDLPQALIAGDVAFAVPTASTVVPHIQSGKLRALAVASPEREAVLPAVPTLKELTGSEDLVQVAWSGIWLPAGAPPAVLRTLFDAHAKVYADPEIAKANEPFGISVRLSASPAEFSAFVAAEQAKFARVVKMAKIETG